jgi:hypothetical protein
MTFGFDVISLDKIFAVLVLLRQRSGLDWLHVRPVLHSSQVLTPRHLDLGRTIRKTVRATSVASSCFSNEQNRS